MTSSDYLILNCRVMMVFGLLELQLVVIMDLLRILLGIQKVNILCLLVRTKQPESMHNG